MMRTSGLPLALLLLSSAISSPFAIYTPAPPLASQISPPSASPTIPPSVPSVETTSCSLTMLPSTLVVRFGDPVTANCSVKTTETPLLGWEVSLAPPEPTMNHFIVWHVANMMLWNITPVCYMLSEQGGQCDIHLPLTVYKPPEAVSLSLVNHTGPMLEGRQYTLQCRVQEVAPAESLVVTFYRGRTPLRRLQSDGRQKSPVNETFSLNINASREDDGVQYWCDATLELGPDGPRFPPVVKSEHLLADVFYKPYFKESSHQDLIQIAEGEDLELNCSAMGNPDPLYTWTLPAASGSSAPRGRVFTKASVTSADAGLYSCSVGNREGTITARFNVEVQADYTVYIIIAVLAAVILLAVVGVSIYRTYYVQTRVGRYNLKDVFGLQTRHTPVPTTA